MVNSTIATFADDTTIFRQKLRTINGRATKKLQQTLKKANKEKIRLNETKSIHINFTNRRLKTPPRLLLNGNTVPYKNEPK